MTVPSDVFNFGDEVPREVVGEGIVRQLMGWDDSLLVARVVFEAGAAGSVHSHEHSQITYVESGEFDVMVDGVEKRVVAGDTVYIQPDLMHGAVCSKAGVLLDIFSPVRADFLEERNAK